jgi:hypothetical protein
VFFKDDPVLSTIPVAPAAPIPVPGGTLKRAIAQTYNRIGGLMSAIASKAGIRVEAALAVWQVESGGLPYTAGRPVLRFENHVFFRHWGVDNAPAFDQHFQFGGRAGVPGKKWQNHKWRQNPGGRWELFHGSQTKEYAVFQFAQNLTGAPEPACLASSFGGPQILGTNHSIVGYPTAKAMFDAMAQSERWEICAFFDFCKSNHILDEARNEDWEGFAAVYNGPGNAVEYGLKIENYFNAALDLSIPAPGAAPPVPVPVPAPALAGAPPAIPPAAPGMGVGLGGAPAIAAADPAYLTDFITFISGLGLRHFKPYELLTMGHQHSDRNSPAFGLNQVPPRNLWNNISLTVQVLDELRQVVGAAIAISSAYRSPAYNQAIAGAGASQHMSFNALDFSVRSSSSPADWAAVLKQMRANGRFKGGIGVYSTFVHLDTRGTNADW